ncbi:hypothetical protein NP493_262g01055 [Ridgeia piscesae]|uniref:Leucine-rich repeat-containing protein 72 n=1 Tax=Ridgeia piscesae TaxID=27915 RepID=A0AAD9NXW9_RIDPI|nr:hypothetical protein NP493_262g01055 [Ridgeia piscesae]
MTTFLCNQLRHVPFLRHNIHLRELYLNDNRLVDVKGVLKNLKSLETLLLHNNQLEKLDTMVHEMAHMQCLRTLNLFGNPLAQEPEYRLYLIHHVPSLEILDRKEIRQSEKNLSKRLYEQERGFIGQKIAFGRRSEGPPYLHFPASHTTPHIVVPVDYEVGNSFYRDSAQFMTLEDAVAARALEKTAKQYTHFDWSRVPRADERRLTKKPYEQPHFITTIFR